MIIPALTNYDFYAPRQIVFGWGMLSEIGGIAKSLGKRAFLVHGSHTLERAGVMATIEDRLHASGVETIPLTGVHREPLVEDVDDVAAVVRSQPPSDGDFLLAVGGGSAIDLAKAVCAMAFAPPGATVKDYLEGVGNGLRIPESTLPLLAVPTTAGTGTEATKNAVISSIEPPFKKSLRSETLIPKIVLVDPELTVSLPATVTAHTGMDAITQLIESYLSRKAKPIPQALCLAGLEAAAASIVTAVNDPSNRKARTGMAHAALLSGMALANSGLGMAHGVAAALGVIADVPHGLACAVMLPAAMKANCRLCEAQFARIGAALTGRNWPTQEAAAEAAIEFILTVERSIGIPSRLSEIGVRREQIPQLVQASRGSSMSGNPRAIDDAELTDILEKLL